MLKPSWHTQSQIFQPCKTAFTAKRRWAVCLAPHFLKKEKTKLQRKDRPSPKVQGLLGTEGELTCELLDIHVVPGQGEDQISRVNWPFLRLVLFA